MPPHALTSGIEDMSGDDSTPEDLTTAAVYPELPSTAPKYLTQTVPDKRMTYPSRSVG